MHQNLENRYIPPLVSLGVALLFSLPFLINWKWIGVGDWELFVTMAAVPRTTILHFGQFPFWNPYIGGGNILFAHPEVGIFSPFFLLILLFGPIGGLKLQFFIAWFLGFYGTFRLARTVGISNMGSYLASFAFFGSSYFALHFSIGHVPFSHFCFLPWFAYFVIKARDSWKYLFAGAVCIALIILGNGAAIPFLYTVFFTGLFVVLFTIQERRFLYFKAFLASIALGLLLASAKFIPMYHYLSQNEWAGMPQDATPLGILFKAFFSFNQGIFDMQTTSEHWGWHEYGAYISPIVIILAIWALVKNYKKLWTWMVLGLFFFIFGLGYFSEFSLWNLILQLPGFSSIRAPSRAFQFVVLSVAILSGFGFDYFREKLTVSKRALKFIGFGIILIVLASNFFINLPNLNTITYKKPEPVEFNPGFKHIMGSKYKIYENFRRNRGSLVAPWLSAYKESRGIVTEKREVLMEYFVGQAQPQILDKEYTPNRVKYEIEPRTPGTMIFGIGYDEGWEELHGREIMENSGLIAVRIDQDTRDLTFVYRTPYFWTGLVVSLFGIVLIFIFYFNSYFRARLKSIFK